MRREDRWRLRRDELTGVGVRSGGWQVRGAAGTSRTVARPGPPPRALPGPRPRRRGRSGCPSAAWRPIPRLGHMADSRAGRPHDRAAPTSPDLAYYAATAYVHRTPLTPAWPHSSCGTSMAARAVPCRGTLAGRRHPRRAAGPAGFCDRRYRRRPGRRLLHRPPRSRLLTCPLRRTPAPPPNRSGAEMIRPVACLPPDSGS